jgi:hypothetical protein
MVGKRKFRAMTDALAASGTDGTIMLDLELVYGHCWGSGPKSDPSLYEIDANRISRRRPSGRPKP